MRTYHDGAAVERDAQSLVETLFGGSGSATVGVGGDHHTDETARCTGNGTDCIHTGVCEWMTSYMRQSKANRFRTELERTLTQVANAGLPVHSR